MDFRFLYFNFCLLIDLIGGIKIKKQTLIFVFVVLLITTKLFAQDPPRKSDNTGDFSRNKTLSGNRAKAVMNALVTKHAVNADQLKAYGVANLSPVTSNKTDGGKARNRRVEIVEQ